MSETYGTPEGTGGGTGGGTPAGGGHSGPPGDTGPQHLPTIQEILDKMREQGLTDLEDLVKAGLAEARKAAESDESLEIEVYEYPGGSFIHVKTQPTHCW